MSEVRGRYPNRHRSGKGKPFSAEDRRCRAYLHALVDELSELWTMGSRDRLADRVPREHDDAPGILGGDGVEDLDVLRRGLRFLEQTAADRGGLSGPIRPEQRGLSAEIDHVRAEIEAESDG